MLDCWQRRRRNVLMHTFHYQFMGADGAVIFRLDTHGGEIPYDGTCHVHVGPEGPKEKILEDDDSRLHAIGFPGSAFSMLSGLLTCT